MQATYLIVREVNLKFTIYKNDIKIMSNVSKDNAVKFYKSHIEVSDLVF